jgi:protein-L-isoaspartate(D-aspartate) O-methyltransferase
MPDQTAARQLMVDSQLRARGVSDPRVLDAMLRVPRHRFVPEPYRSQSYEDHPLPIGDNQTISQPYIVALMLDSLQLAPTDKVLEVGTGSGYVTALLAEPNKFYRSNAIPPWPRERAKFSPNWAVTTP